MKLTILVALFFTSTASFAGETIGKIIGQLGMAEGEVFVDNRAVSKNSPLREGSTVEVKDGKATLLLGSGSVFHLAANSKMIVKQFGMRADSKKEGGDVSLSFGRTRALILNKGDETKDVRIITRTATMGVRGTEIFIDAPKDISKPVQFFTLEGLAHVDIPKAPRVEVKQNTGVSTSSAQSPGDAGKAGAAKMSLAEVKNEIKSNSMQVAKMNTPTDMNRVRGEYTHDPALNIPFPRFDPIQDRLTPLNVVPKFCNATSSSPCP
jgi:hypothetical protein